MWPGINAAHVPGMGVVERHCEVNEPGRGIVCRGGIDAVNGGAGIVNMAMTVYTELNSEQLSVLAERRKLRTGY